MKEVFHWKKLTLWKMVTIYTLVPMFYFQNIFLTCLRRNCLKTEDHLQLQRSITLYTIYNIFESFM